MVSRTTLFVIAFSIASILIIALIAITLTRSIIKENEDTNIQDVMGVIQAITGIIGVPLGIFSIVSYFIDRDKQRNSRSARDKEAGLPLLQVPYQYSGDLVANAKKHIKDMCELQKKRYRVFKLNNSANDHFTADLIRMKYDDKASNIDGSKWVEDLSIEKQLNSEQIMRMITEKRNTPLNLLIEVSIVASNSIQTQFQAHAGCGKTNLLHHIASCWQTKNKLLRYIDLLLLVRCEDIRTNLTSQIEKIAGSNKNIKKYHKWECDERKRIVILLDGYDEIAGNGTNDSKNLKEFIERPNKNIVFIMSTQRHKTDAIAGGDNHINWTVVRCVGINEDSIIPFIHSRICCNENGCNKNKNKVEQISAALKKNELDKIPLFILIACQVFEQLCKENNNTTINLDMYDLMNGFYRRQLNKLETVPQTFLNTLGWFAIISDSVELVNTKTGQELIKIKAEQELVASQDYSTWLLFNNETITTAAIKEMYEIGCSIGLLTRHSNVYNSRYSFMHKTVAEFAAAKLLYDTNLWEQVNSLDIFNSSILHYYLLMNSINLDKTDKDRKLWNVQLSDKMRTSLPSDVWYTIHWASKCGYYKIIEKLFIYDISMAKQKTKYLEYTPLMLVTENGHMECLTLMLHNKHIKISIDDQNHFGSTALMLAAYMGRASCLKLLIDQNAKINMQDKYGGTALICATIDGHDKCVKLLIDSGADVHKQNKDGYTALMRAAIDGHDKCVQLLIDNGADVDKQNKNENTALMCAAMRGHHKCVKLLIGNGADVNKQNKYNGCTALIWAAMKGHDKCVQLLIDNGAGVNTQDKYGYAALIRAAMSGHDKCAKLLIDNDADVNKQNKNGCTALILAAMKGHDTCVKLLIDNDADFNVQDEEGNAALIWAAMYEHDKCVQLLVYNDADIHKKNKNWNTALSYAAASGHLECVKYLIDKGAHFDMQDLQGDTPLMNAAMNGHYKCLELLINRGADVSIVNNDGKTALFCAAMKGHNKCVQILVDKGAGINQQDKEGHTALKAAACNGHADCVEYLIDKGADLNLGDCDRDTPLMNAAFHGHYKCIELLINGGVDILLTNNDGKTALDWAREKGHDECATLLQCITMSQNN
jgi:ankyrin repeat protein